MKEMNPFDEKIRQSLEGHEMPYDPAAWTALQSQLPSTPVGGSTGFGWKGIAAVAVVTTAVVSSLLLMNNDKDVVDNQVVEAEVAAPEQASSSVILSDEGKEQELTVQEETNEVFEHESSENLVSESNGADIRSEKATSNEDSEPEKVTERSNTTTTSEKSSAPVKITPENTESFKADFITSATVVCAGEPVSFINESSDKSASLIWTFGDGETNSESNPTHSYVLPGTYNVTLLGNKGAEESRKEISITVNPAPMPMLSAERMYAAVPLYKFATAVQPNETATWSFSDGRIANGNNVEHLFRTKGSSSAILTVKNGFGCTTSVDETYFLEQEFTLLAPTGFTPNNDGLNETFVPEALISMEKAFTMTIQDPRNGSIVFQTSNANDGWNGTMNNNGQKLEEGVYVWTVVIEDHIANNRVFNGKINLQRK